MKITVNHFSAKKQEPALIKKTAKAALKELGKDGLDSELVINVVPSRTMKKVNYRFRGRNQTTDVLSFAYQKDKKLPLKVWGELFIDRLQVLKNSQLENSGYQQELKTVIIHGILHLSGYHHEQVPPKTRNKMFRKQKQIFLKLRKRYD
ncbi:MAG: hypothetical protein ACD_68C00064G0004 [uncultured bacterium]|nr:MAG: hypothetical protein ACD_68C00064G0004 [uncultured bacterium]